MGLLGSIRKGCNRNGQRDQNQGHRKRDTWAGFSTQEVEFYTSRNLSPPKAPAPSQNQQSQQSQRRQEAGVDMGRPIPVIEREASGYFPMQRLSSAVSTPPELATSPEGSAMEAYMTAAYESANCPLLHHDGNDEDNHGGIAVRANAAQIGADLLRNGPGRYQGLVLAARRLLDEAQLVEQRFPRRPSFRDLSPTREVSLALPALRNLVPGPSLPSPPPSVHSPTRPNFLFPPGPPPTSLLPPPPAHTTQGHVSLTPRHPDPPRPDGPPHSVSFGAVPSPVRQMSFHGPSSPCASIISANSIATTILPCLIPPPPSRPPPPPPPVTSPVDASLPPVVPPRSVNRPAHVQTSERVTGRRGKCVHEFEDGQNKPRPVQCQSCRCELFDLLSRCRRCGLRVCQYCKADGQYLHG